MSIKPEEIFIVIPSYNEGKVIANTIAPLIKAGYTVVVVDDCSGDETRQALSAMPVYYLKHVLNKGQGAALQTGFSFALEKGAEYVVTFDADGQHNYREIASLLEPVIEGRADITLGSRFKRSEDVKEIPASRRLVLKIGTLVNGLLTGMWLTDAHNGFRALNRKALIAFNLRENRMAHASEILTQIRQAKLRYEEVPVNVVYTAYSKMKGQSHSNSLNILIDLLLNKIV